MCGTASPCGQQSCWVCTQQLTRDAISSLPLRTPRPFPAAGTDNYIGKLCRAQLVAAHGKVALPQTAMHCSPCASPLPRALLRCMQRHSAVTAAQAHRFLLMHAPHPLPACLGVDYASQLTLADYGNVGV